MSRHPESICPHVYTPKERTYTALAEGLFVEAFQTQNSLTQEVWYTGRTPQLIFGRIFRLQTGARLSAMRVNTFAHMAITIAEASLHSAFPQNHEHALRILSDNIPDHILQIGNWFKWQQIIGTEKPVVPFGGQIDADEGFPVITIN